MMPVTVFCGLNHRPQLRIILTGHRRDGKSKLLFTCTSNICQKNLEKSVAFQRHLINLRPYFLLHADGDFLRLRV